jgi:DnaJ-class molecular chaperone
MNKLVIDPNIFNTNFLPRCQECQGIGLVKCNVIICTICKGKKCIQCNSKGIIQMPYDECKKCHGSGKQIYTFEQLHR